VVEFASSPALRRCNRHSKPCAGGILSISGEAPPVSCELRRRSTGRRCPVAAHRLRATLGARSPVDGPDQIGAYPFDRSTMDP
jgi:hypothetical protein